MRDAWLHCDCCSCYFVYIRTTLLFCITMALLLLVVFYFVHLSFLFNWFSSASYAAIPDLC